MFKIEKGGINVRTVQIISVISLLVSSFIKFDLIDFDLNKNIVHYFFNASAMLTTFSIIFPLISYYKLQKLDPKISNSLDNIMNEIDPHNNIDIFISDKYLKNNVAVLFRKNQLVIVFGKELINSLDTSQIKFLLAHEYFHIKENHLMKNIFSFIFVLAGIPILLLSIAPLLIPLTSILTVIIITVFVYVTSFILHFLFSQRREYLADKYASQFVGEKIAEETLIILRENNMLSERSYSLFETHPSIKKRIENIKSF